MDVGNAQRIAVIGSPGAGKSTLATTIAAATGLPLIHLDREYWQPGWVEPDKVEWRARNAALVAHERWVIDGNYGSSIPARLVRADLVVWLDLPTWSCLMGAVRRVLRYRGRSRPDMREGCPERFDVAFFRYILTFRRDKRAAIERALTESGLTVVHLTSVADRARFARALEATASPRSPAPPDRDLPPG